MGMTLIALASAALADPARSPPPPRHCAHLGRAAMSAIAASLSSRYRPAAASTVIMPPPHSRPPSCRSAGRRCVAEFALAAPPPCSPPTRARRHCAADPLGRRRADAL